MDEILVSEEECHRTIQVGDYYSILPILPELSQRQDARHGAVLTKEFSSRDIVLDFVGTVELLKKHKLLIGQTMTKEGGELLA
jgi:UDP-glucose 4-epimerase